MEIVTPYSATIAALTSACATPGPLFGAKLRWWGAVVTPNPQTVLADLPAATFDGNAISAAVVAGTPFIGADNLVRAVGASKQVVQTGVVTTGPLNGWALVGDPSGTAWLAAAVRYATEKSMVSINRGDVVTPEITLTPGVGGVVYTADAHLRCLTYLKGTGKLYDGAILKLGTNVTQPTKEALIGTMTEATFNGYAASAALVWGTPFISPTGQVRLEAPSVQFTAGTPTGPETITCAYLVLDPLGTPALGCVYWFDDPVVISAPAQGVVVDVLVTLDQSGA